jgi:DNA (cytosine-5)-methyltransferase 1
MKFGSVFSGIGGIDLGLERAGMRCAWQIERNAKCRSVLKRHWPGVPLYGDVNAGMSLRMVDLIAGGPPCQPFSSASHGRKHGTADNRWLWPPMRRLVQALRPPWVLVENVPHFDGPGLEAVVADLESDGYEVAPPLEIPACAFGFDHRRSRLWILGYADRHGEPSQPVDAEVAVLPVGGGSQPDELGEADGVPGWMDRLGMLGNAVVPAQAEWIGRAIMNCEGGP